MKSRIDSSVDSFGLWFSANNCISFDSEVYQADQIIIQFFTMIFACQSRFHDHFQLNFIRQEVVCESQDISIDALYTLQAITVIFQNTFK